MTNTFFIGWIDPDNQHADIRRGRIVAQDLDEVFDAPLEVWSAADYENQWREGLSRLVEGADLSTLVTRLMRGRGASFGGEQWTLYRVGDLAILQNQLILPATVPGFDPEDPYRTIEARDEHALVSEWRVPVRAVEDFLATRMSQS